MVILKVGNLQNGTERTKYQWKSMLNLKDNTCTGGFRGGVGGAPPPPKISQTILFISIFLKLRV
jgi:hypothetical protein